jgi:hypothetical protein
MKVARREFYNVSRSDEWHLYPIGDVHLGNAGCDEALLRQVVAAIAADDKALWVGLGDMAEFINVSDPRFSIDSLAKWVKVMHLADLAKAQITRLLDILEPIAGKCLALIEGNHEDSIHRHTERDVYSEIVTGIKERGKFAADHTLGLGYSGWLMLHFYRSEEKRHATTIRVNLHHGYSSGRKMGGKANAMQDRMLRHDADLCIMGHCHDEMALPVAVETVRGGKVVKDLRKGCFSGTFLDTAEYAEKKGYLPQAVLQPLVLLTPGEELQKNRIRVVV